MDDIPLGKPTAYPNGYDPNLLARIERAPARALLGVADPPPFVGEDLWNGYEFSWLNARGKPQVSGLRLRVGADSPCMVESKSMKLYLNGFAQARFDSAAAVAELLATDLGRAFGAPVAVALPTLAELGQISALPGDSLDDLDIAADVYQRDPDLLATDRAAPAAVEETLHTQLFRSLCPVTGQPDWASMLIRYTGPAIERDSLLRYLISFRNHQAFHETTVEQIYLDLMERCRCERLLVGGYFLRRGGVDINPLRADTSGDWPALRLARQ